MSKKRERIKQAILDRKLLKQVVNGKAISKVKDLLTESILRQKQSELTAEQVRNILGVQIPKQQHPRRGQGTINAMDPENGLISDQQIRSQNNRKTDSNRADRPIERQDSRGIKHTVGPAVNIGRDVIPDIDKPLIKDERRQIKSSPQNIHDEAQKMKNTAVGSDDSVSNTGTKRQQIKRRMSDAPSQRIPTSTQQNIKSKQKEKQDMEMNQDKQEQWIKESLQMLQNTNIYEQVGINIKPDPNGPSLQVIPQTFADGDDLPIEGEEAQPVIQQPSAVRQGITDYAKALPGDPNSNMPTQFINQRQASTDPHAQVDRQLKVEATQSPQNVQAPKGKKVITEEPKQKKELRQAKLRKVMSQNTKLKMFVDFIINHRNKLNEGMVKQLRAMIDKTTTPQSLKQRYTRCDKLITQKHASPVTQKKIFEGNRGKFNKINESLLKSRTRATIREDPQSSRLRQLAGL